MLECLVSLADEPSTCCTSACTGACWPESDCRDCRLSGAVRYALRMPAETPPIRLALTADEAPDPVATSLLMLGSTATDRNSLTRRILRELAQRIDAWRTVLNDRLRRKN